ncbi:family 43 glycosylhydrolase [Promicromonospora alba]|uniref:Family 43 glycosylhydrolase n=1 Tax=Promicromonospora alba TaxID=1616110 RepID=A0ABV9HBG1_9MICO
MATPELPADAGRLTDTDGWVHPGGLAANEPLIANGVPWFDDRGQTVNAHGACIIEEAGRYYLFGEYKTDDENRFIGFSCYSSPDLATWSFERLVLRPQQDGLLGPQRIGERVKVMKCPSTGQFVMYMHTDDLSYADPHIGLATCETIAGDYTFHGALQHDGEPIRRWDMGSFQDGDGTGYLLLHEGDIYRLSDDYLAADEKVTENVSPGGESPAMWAQDGVYYLLFSNKTSWERNDNYYLSAPSPAGPWTHRGPIAPEGTLTFNSQCTYVFGLTTEGGTVPMYMGDRWSFPRQASAATYVWLPLSVDGDCLELGEYLPLWSVRTGRPAELGAHGAAVQFRSNTAGVALEVPWAGEQVAVIGSSDCHSSYAEVEILDAQRRQVAFLLVDFYSLVPDDGLRYVSPRLPKSDYTLRIAVTGERPAWFKKNGERFGPRDSSVSISEVITVPDRLPRPRPTGLPAPSSPAR